MKTKLKLIKLSETHYIVVDDSPLKKGDGKYPVYGCKGTIYQDCPESWKENGDWKKITHSTKPLEYEWDRGVKDKFFDKVRLLTLSEAQEIEFGYSAEKIMFVKDNFILTKSQLEDILFTALNQKDSECCVMHTKDSIVRKIIQSILPKTEWDVEFDANGKLKLL